MRGDKTPNDPKSTFEHIALVLGFFLWGCTGYIWFYRKIAYQAITVRGKPAQVLGVIMMGSWVIAISFLFEWILG
ncbi:MAG: hypothetical protein GY755_09680 [Chloroflexi bacterium]|nr:hypothetical protein [Chloroflexota bacterium]